jgi:hypothetical protein
VNQIDSPVLGLDKGRVDTDGTGKLRERSPGHIDALALHLEAIKQAKRAVSLRTLMAGGILESADSRRLLAHRSVEPKPSRIFVSPAHSR